MLVSGNNNVMEEYSSNAQTVKSSSNSGVKSNTVQVRGSNSGVISEYSSGRNPKTNSPAANNGNAPVSGPSAEKKAKQNSSVSPAANNGNAPVSGPSAEKKAKQNSSVSPAANNGNASVSGASTEQKAKQNSSVSPAANNGNAPVSGASTEQKAKSNGYQGGQGCTPNRSRFPAETPDAMAYVPFQQLGTTYPADRGLVYGTIFPELNKPFLGGGMKK